MSEYLGANSIIAGNMGTVSRKVINADGTTSWKDVLEVKDISVKATKQKQDIKVLGTSVIQSKTTGVKITGSCTIYWVSNEFVQDCVEYCKSNVETYYVLKVEVNDPSSNVGKSSVILEDVTFDSADITKASTSQEFLESTMDFTVGSLGDYEGFTNDYTRKSS